jgi:hypothetical protein
VLPLAAGDPLFSLDDLNLCRTRHQRERKEHEKTVNDGDSVRGFHAAPFVGG